MVKRNMVKEDMKCCHPYHKGKGVMALVLGALILANSYWTILGWADFIGVILVLTGLIKMLVPHKN